MTSHLGVKTYRFGETAPHWYGKEAAAIRRHVKAEFAAALAMYDADPTPKRRAACEALADTEAEVARRVAAEAPTGLSSFGSSPVPGLAAPRFNPSRKRNAA